MTEVPIRRYGSSKFSLYIFTFDFPLIYIANARKKWSKMKLFQNQNVDILILSNDLNYRYWCLFRLIKTENGFIRTKTNLKWTKIGQFWHFWQLSTLG